MSTVTPFPNKDDSEPFSGHNRMVCLMDEARKLRREGLNATELYEELHIINKALCQPPLDDEVVKSVAIASSKLSIKRGKDLSDDALAIRLSAERFNDNYRYVPDRNQWMQWDGSRWLKDKSHVHVTICREFLRELAKTETERKAIALQSDRKCTAVIHTATSNPELVVLSEQFDRDRWLLGTPDGTVNLRTGEVHAPARADYITRQVVVTPQSGGAPQWHKFLKRIFKQHPEIIPFLQRAFGYALTGQTTEHKLLFAFGSGRNGKSVFLNTLSGIMGDYATQAAAATFMESGVDQHPADLAMLEGARLVTASELPPGKAWNESRIKSITGGDPITARRMRQDFFTYQPQFSLIIAGNHMPSFRGIDEAIRARVLLIPFNEVIPEAERDPDLTDKLKAEWPQILQWGIDGALEWGKHGLAAPECVKAASADYLEGEDILGQFIGENLVQEAGGFVLTRAIYDVFKDWCEQRGMRPWLQQTLTKAMQERGYVSHRKKQGRGFKGWKLKHALNLGELEQKL